MTYSELAAVLLAATALILAALGFFIAVLAVLGWSQFRSLVRKSSTDTAKSHIDHRLKDGDLRRYFEEVASSFLDQEFETGPLRKLIERRVDQMIYGGANQRTASLDEENREE